MSDASSDIAKLYGLPKVRGTYSSGSGASTPFTVIIGRGWKICRFLHAAGLIASVDRPRRPGARAQLSRDSWLGQRIGDALAVEINDGVMDGLVERVGVG